MSDDTESGDDVRIDESVAVPTTEDLPTPSPDRSPEDVLKTVLSALRDNDRPRSNAGVATLFAFSAPGYRAEVGGYEGLLDRLAGRVYGPLLDHERAKRGRLRREGDRATEKVVVTDDEGEATTFRFSLERIRDGEYADCWLVSGLELTYVGDSPDHSHAPLVEFEGTTVKCGEGDVLRDVLLRATGVSPADSDAAYANCNGKGLCGTCAVRVPEGVLSEKTAREKRRLRLPPHDEDDDPAVRLACQCRVLGDVTVERHRDHWAGHVAEYSPVDPETTAAEPIRSRRGEFPATSPVVDDEASRRLPPAEEDDSDGYETLDERTRSLLEEADELLEDG